MHLRPRPLHARRTTAILTGAAVLTWASAVWSQPAAPWGSARPTVDGAPAGQGEGEVVAPIEVVKHLAGPALWKVTKGSSQVFILGAATPLPHLLQWDTVRLENALNGASALYLQPRPSLSALELMKLAVDRGALQLPHGQTLETVLPASEKARFLRLMVTIHGKAETYDHWKPAIAGLYLVADYRRAAGLSEGKPATTVMHLAEDAHVPVRYVGDFHLDPYVATASKLSMADNIACFDAALDDIDQESAHAPAMAAAWAKADLKTVGATYKASLLTGCLERIPSVQGLLDKGTREGVETIQMALVSPGKSVAVIDLNFLLRSGGVLDRLKIEGAQVTTPQ